MKKESVIYLIFVNISKYNEKIMLGFILLNNDNIILHINENRLKAIELIKSNDSLKPMYDMLYFLKTNIDSKKINVSEIKCLPQTKGLLEFQLRKLESIVTDIDILRKTFNI